MEKTNVIQKSMGWSLFSEIAAKFVTPVTNMILARILVPEDFGILAICNMLVSFMDIITDAGFGKYLVQYDFADDEEKGKYANVAFWSNFVISATLFLLIVIGRKPIAGLLGNRKYSTAISVASLQLIFTSMSSIQTGLFRRSFDFKKLFITRMSVAIAPLLITVPLAFVTRSFWSLIIGNLAGAFINALILTIMSSWKPRFFYSFELLKKMFGFSFWSLCEGLAHWSIFWVDTFIVTSFCSEYYVGIYKNSANMIYSIMGMISASMSPVLLSVLSRVKSDKDRFFDVFLTIQRIMLYLVIPMGFGLFCYRKIITLILFGSKWSEATTVIGGWGLMMMCSVIFYSFTAELYKSQGIPQILFLFQCSYIIFLVPMCLVSIRFGFWNFVYTRCFCVIEQIILSMVFLNLTFHFSIRKLLENIIKPLIASMSIVVTSIVFSFIGMNSNLAQFIFMVLSGLTYLIVIALFFRKDLFEARDKIQNVRL